MQTDAVLFFGPPTGRKGVIFIPCNIIWTAHFDSICMVCPMHEHGCLVTGSHDGFKRMWNMDTDCLGELPLPNMTHKMKNPQKPIFAHKSWKFILEKIPITAAHRAIAEFLVRAVQNPPAEDLAKGHHERHRHIDANDLAGLNFDQDEEEEGGGGENLSDQQRLRRYVLTTMVAPVKMPVDGPPLTIPSRLDRKLAAIALALDTHRMQADLDAERDGAGQGNGGFFLTEASDTTTDAEPSTATLPTLPSPGRAHAHAGSSPHPSPARPAPGNQSSSPLPNPGVFRSNTPGHGGVTPKTRVTPKKSLYYAAGEGVTDKAFMVSPAFSTTSLNDGAMQKVLDDESHMLLSRFSAMQAEKVEQYEASGSTIVLRRPELSTSIVLPDLSSMRRAEIAFGEQKDLYRNAEQVLNDRDNLKKDKMRDAITRSRIDYNVKKMSSMMMTVVTPVAHDDVSIPNPQEAYQGMKERGEKQSFRMRVRLMQSASLVSLEAKVCLFCMF